jgi:hypothetical protein
VAVHAIFVFFLLLRKQGTQMNESFPKSRYHCLLFAFLFVFIGLVEHCGRENSGSS